MTDALLSLDQQIANLTKNLALIEQRTSEFVLSTDVPLQLVSEKEQVAAQLAELTARRARLLEIPCPYRSLEVFEAEHAANYFGRKAMVQKLVAKLKTTNFVAVVGPSGSGKSSLVRAGLISALRNGALPGSAAWDVTIVRPGEGPLRSLAQPLVARLATDLTPVERLAETRKLAGHLRKGTLPIGDMLAQLDEQPNRPVRWVLLIDQFEETFTLCSDEGLRRTFLSALVAMAEAKRLTIMLTLRADFYGRVLEVEHFGALVDVGLVNVLPMNEAERRAAIEQPALNAGRSFEEGLVERILAAVAEETGELPLLEFALTELWERQNAQGVLTHAAYEEIGEVAGAIAKRADDIWSSFGPENKTATRRLFTRLVRVAQPDEGAEDTKRRIRLQELDADTQELVLKLADARLLVTDRDVNTGEVTVEVAHEALIRNWQDLQAWLNGDREFLLWRQRLRTMVDNWVESGRDEGALLRGALLTEAEAWDATRAGDLSDLEKEFLHTSRAVINREEAAREAARQRDIEQTKALANRQRWLLITTGVILVLVVGAGLFIYRQNDQLRESEAEAVAAKATAETSADLANQQLARLEGLRLYQEANALRDARDVDGAIAKYHAAEEADMSLNINVTKEISETLRYAALQLVYEGEALAKQDDFVGAKGKFEEALALNPPSNTPVYVWIEPGRFTMGSTDEHCKQAGLDDCRPDEQPTHTVQLDGYWILRTEVTHEQYRRCMDMTEENECTVPQDGRIKNERFSREPVVGVTQEQAQAYARWVGGRLPSEAEWEKACRWDANEQLARLYPWGDDAPGPERLNYKSTFFGGPSEVGSYPPGANGLYDMAGNMWEWTADWYEENYYANSPLSNPQRPESGGDRTLRGGSFGANSINVRCAYRGNHLPPNANYNTIGFRIVISSSPGL